MRFSPGQRVERYEIESSLGIAGSAETYRAVDPEGVGPVILKLIPCLPLAEGAEPDEAWLAVVRGARRLTRLYGDGIPPIFEVLELPEGLLIVQQDAPGQRLRTYLAEGGEVDRELLVRWGGRLLGLLAEIHSQEILHRHLSEDTVLIDEEGRALLTGFSLSNLVDDPPGSRAPEEIKGGPLSPKSDLYALGALLTRLAGRGRDDVLRPGDPSWPTFAGGPGAGETLPPGDPLWQVLSQATAENPEDRFEDALEMEAAFRAAAEAGPPQPMTVEPVAGTEEAPAFGTQILNPAMLGIDLENPPGAGEAEVDETVAAPAPSPEPSLEPVSEASVAPAKPPPPPTPQSSAREAAAQPEAADPVAQVALASNSPPVARSARRSRPALLWPVLIALLTLVAVLLAGHRLGLF